VSKLDLVINRFPHHESLASKRHVLGQRTLRSAHVVHLEIVAAVAIVHDSSITADNSTSERQVNLGAFLLGKESWWGGLKPDIEVE
jgi:hypothetical protein